MSIFPWSERAFSKRPVHRRSRGGNPPTCGAVRPSVRPLLALLPVLAVVACGQTRAPAVHATAPPPARVATTPIASAAPPPAAAPSCAPGEKVALRAPETFTIDCLSGPCHPRMPIWIDNCTDEPLYLRSAGDGRVLFEMEPLPEWRVPARARTRFDYPIKEGGWLRAGPYALTLTVAASEDAPAATLSARGTIVDAATERAKADCLASGGDWGSHGGFVREVGCEPIMRDAGRVCSDESDCQGLCVFEREEPISPTEKRVYGRCSRFRYVMGCRSLIGPTNHGRMPRNSHLGRVCVD